jgi:phosphate uptake regulator
MAARMPQNEQDDTLDELLLNRFDEVICLVTVSDPLRLDLLSHYAILKIQEFRRRGQMDDLEEAISKQSQAVEGTAEDHPDLAMYLSNLGNKFESRFERTGRMEDLEESIRRGIHPNEPQCR